MIKGSSDEQISQRLGSVIALAERLRRRSKKIGRSPHSSDLRLAALYLRGYAVLLLAESAVNCTDPKERDALVTEALQLKSEAH